MLGFLSNIIEGVSGEENKGGGGGVDVISDPWCGVGGRLGRVVDVSLINPSVKFIMNL